MKELSINAQGKVGQLWKAKMPNGNTVTVLPQAPQPAETYPSDKWCLVQMPEGDTRIIQKKQLRIMSKAA